MGRSGGSQCSQSGWPLPGRTRALLGWLDDPHAVDALLVQHVERVFVELEVDMDDAELLAVAERQDFTFAPVRNRSDERAGSCGSPSGVTRRYLHP
jgi:hypothetical protein